MISPEQIVEKARGMIGTPFRHQARVPGERGGLDCVGLTVCIGWQLGLRIEDRTDYARETDGEVLRNALEQHCDLVDEMRLGDIVQFLRGRSMWHVGVVSRIGSRPMMIHAKSQAGGGGEVREDHIDAAWMRRLAGVWRYRSAA